MCTWGTFGLSNAFNSHDAFDSNNAFESNCLVKLKISCARSYRAPIRTTTFHVTFRSTFHVTFRITFHVTFRITFDSFRNTFDSLSHAAHSPRMAHLERKLNVGIQIEFQCTTRWADRCAKH